MKQGDHIGPLPFDHAGGFAELKARTGAELVATRESAALLAAGGRGDLHYGDAFPFPPASVDRWIDDGERVRVGQHTLTALRTPGHTPGSTTWTWREVVDGQSIDVVYADSLTAPGYRLVGNDRYPLIVADFDASADRIASLPCDVLVTPHPQAADVESRRERRSSADAALISPGACSRYGKQARIAIDREVARQAGATSPGRAAHDEPR